MVKVEWENETEELETRSFKAENPEQCIRTLNRVVWNHLPRGFHTEGRNETFCVRSNFEPEKHACFYIGEGKVFMRFSKHPEIEQIILETLEEIFGNVEWEQLTAEEKRRRIKLREEMEKRKLEQLQSQHIERIRQRCISSLKEKLTPLDYKILEMRSKGLSLWSIATELGVTMAKVRYSLQKLALIPECAEKLGAYKPLPWNQRFKYKT